MFDSYEKKDVICIVKHKENYVILVFLYANIDLYESSWFFENEPKKKKKQGKMMNESIYASAYISDWLIVDIQ